MERYEINPALAEYLRLGREQFQTQERLNAEHSTKALRVVAFAAVIFAFAMTHLDPERNPNQDQWPFWFEQYLGIPVDFIAPSTVLVGAFILVILFAGLIACSFSWEDPANLRDARKALQTAENPNRVVWVIAESYRVAVEHNSGPLRWQGWALRATLVFTGVQVLSAIVLI